MVSRSCDDGGMFAISKCLRYAKDATQTRVEIKEQVANISRAWRLAAPLPQSVCAAVSWHGHRALPGRGRYRGMDVLRHQQRFSREPEKFGTGHVEGIVEAGAANNSALAGAWIPALVFGIPGDSITAIVIGVLYMKNMAPGPMIFTNSPVQIYAVFLVFILANLIMLPLGYLAVRLASRVLNVPRNILMPLILLFCIVGTFAINNSVFDVMVMLAMGVLAFVMEENDFPIAPAVLGVVWRMLEEHFIFSMIKADGDFMMFFSRPIAGALGAFAILVWLTPLIKALVRLKARPARRARVQQG